MFKSHITEALYKDFLADFSVRPFSINSKPFVLVDPKTGAIQLLAGSYEGETEDDYSPLSITQSLSNDGNNGFKD